MDSIMEMQYRIRQQSEIQREYVEDLYRWEDQMKAEDQNLRKKAQAKKIDVDLTSAPVRESRGNVSTRAGAARAHTVHDPAKRSEADAAGMVPSDELETLRNMEGFMSASSSSAAGAASSSSSSSSAQPVKKIKPKNYMEYDQWDEFDADAEIARVEREEAEREAERHRQRLEKERAERAREAESERVKAEESDPKLRAESLKNRGNSAFRDNDLDHAMDMYTQAIQLDPNNHVLFSNRAACALRMRKWSSALHDTNKALGLNSDFAKSRMRRAQAYTALGDLEHALEDLDLLVEKHPMDMTFARERQRVSDMLREKKRKAAAGQQQQQQQQQPRTEPQRGGQVPQERRRKMKIQEVQTSETAAASAAAPPAAAASTASASPPLPPTATAAAAAAATTTTTTAAAAAATGGSAQETKRKVVVVHEEKEEEKKMQEEQEEPPVEEVYTTGSIRAGLPQAREQERLREMRRAKMEEQRLKEREEHEEKEKREKNKARGEQNAGAEGGGPRAAAGSVSSPAAVPRSAPRTSYEFEIQWRSFRGDTQAQAQYLELITPAEVPRLFKHLEGPVFMGILTAISERWSDRPALALEWLQALQKIDRFDVNVMFLSESEKKVIRTIVGWLEDSQDKKSVCQAYEV